MDVATGAVDGAGDDIEMGAETEGPAPPLGLAADSAVTVTLEQADTTAIRIAAAAILPLGLRVCARSLMSDSSNSINRLVAWCNPG